MLANSLSFCVYGRYALFSDPVTRIGGEKCSYQIPTYEAMKGVAKSIYWKPTFTWYVDRVRVMKPIQMETKGIRPIKYVSPGNDLSYYTYLKDVYYQVEVHFEWNSNRPEFEYDRISGKHFEIARRMIDKGGRKDIFLGTRECQAYVEPCCFGEGKGFYDEIPELSFGYMYHGITYPDEAYSDQTRGMITVHHFLPVMRNGIITYPRPEDCPESRTIRKAIMKEFPVSDHDSEARE